MTELPNWRNFFRSFKKIRSIIEKKTVWATSRWLLFR